MGVTARKRMLSKPAALLLPPCSVFALTASSLRNHHDYAVQNGCRGVAMVQQLLSRRQSRCDTRTNAPSW
jgi:hypothetical protein